MVVRRAQYAMEFMLVFAFSLAIIIPVIALLNSQYQESRSELDQAQAEDVLDEFQVAGQRVWFSGYPSRTTLELYFPRGITAIGRTTVDTSKGVRTSVHIEMERSGSRDNVTRVFTYPVNISIFPTEGKKRILVKAESLGYVNITEVR